MRRSFLLVLALMVSGSVLVAQTSFPDGQLDPTRHSIAQPATTPSPLREEYIWTAGGVTAKRQDRTKFPWRIQVLRTEPHFFRAHFNLRTVPGAATLYIAGPRQATVYLNGKQLANFTSNIDAPIGFHVFHADAASFLIPGENTLAIRAIRGRGIVSGGGTLATAQLAYGEILVVKLVPSGFGKTPEPILISNSEWRSTLSADEHWYNKSFDDRQWPQVESLGPIEHDLSFFQWSADAGMYGWPGYTGMSHFLRTYKLSAQRITHTYEGLSHFLNLEALTAAPQADTSPPKNSSKLFAVSMPAVPVVDSEAPTLMLDFGREVNGRLLVESACACEATLSVAYGESEIEAMSTGLAPGQQGGNFLGTNIIDVPAGGVARGPKSAFRYARITFLRGAQITNFRNIGLEGIYYPVTYEGSFESSDTLLNRIWETGAYTAHLCMQDDVWDAPKRDRGRWSGDLDISGRVITDVFGDSALLEDTLTNLIAAPGRTTTGIPSYVGLWLTTLYNLHQHSGDTKFLTTQHANILNALATMDATLDTSGNFSNPNHAWLFVDWAPGMNSYTLEARIGTQMQYVRAYLAGSKLLSELGDASASAKYEAQAKRVADSTRAAYRNEISHTYGSTWHLNALAVLSLDEQTNNAIWQEVLSHVKQDSPADPIVTPYFGAYLLDAMSQMGHRQEALKWVRTYWGGMLAEGATSFWEAYDLRWQKENPHLALQADGTTGYFISLAHGWSSGPTAWLQREVLGINPTSPGFKTVNIRPDLLDLAWARGSTATPNGPIMVSVDAKMGIVVVLPENEDALVSVPIHNKDSRILVNGNVLHSNLAENATRAIISLRTGGHYVITTQEP